MRWVWVAVALLAVAAQAPCRASPMDLLDLLLDAEAEVEAGSSVSALHREYDKSWRHRVGSAAAEPAAEDEDVAEGDAGGAAKEVDSAFEDAVPKRRRYNRKRPRPEDVDGEAGPKRRKYPADDDAQSDEYRRKKPGQRRRRPARPDAEPTPSGEDVEEDTKNNEPVETPSTTEAQSHGQGVSPGDLKALLKQTAGQLSLSELLQNRNLSLSDLLKGNRGALSALTSQHGKEPASPASTSPPSPATSAASATPDADKEPSTERQNSFVPSKPRRLPPVIRPTTGLAPPRTTATTGIVAPSEEPEVTTSRPRRLPAVVARVKAEQNAKAQQAQQAQSDALDPMSPAMMAMITLEAADSHTSKPRRIPPATSTAAPSTSAPPATTPDKEAEVKTTLLPASTTSSTTLPPREFYPLNVDSLEITTPRLMGVSKASQPGKPSWLPPADRIIDAQVFSPGAIPSKFRPHGFVPSPAGPAGTEYGEHDVDEKEERMTTPPVPAPAPQGPTTLQNTSDHFRLENETLDLKEGSNALDKRKIGPSRLEQALNATSTPQQTSSPNELEKAEKRKPVTSTSTSTSTSTGPRRLPPTLAGTRRLPAPNPALTRPKGTTEAPAPAPTSPERPRLPFLVNKRSKDKEREREREKEREREREREREKERDRERDSLLPPTRFALPLPEVISIEKMIADARSRGALDGTTASFSTPSERTTAADITTTTTASTTAATSTTFASRDEILDLLKSEQSSTRLSRILAERNMTLEDLLQHRERGSSQLHFADFFRNASTAATSPTQGGPVDDIKPAVDLVPKEIAPAERKESVNILRSFHEVPKYPFAYSGADDSEEAASTLSLVNVKPAGIVLPADPGERYHHRSTAPVVAAAAPSRAPRVIPPQQTNPPPPPPPPQAYPIPTYRLPDPPAHASNPYLVIKHVPEVPERDRPDAVVLEHVGEIRHVGVSSSVEEAIVVDSNVRDRDRGDRVDRLSLPSGVKSAIIASTVICGLAIVGFLTIFIVFRWRQKRALIRARGAILCEQLQRGSFRGRSLSPVLVNVSKNSQVQPMQSHGHLQQGGPLPYYSKKDLNSRATSNTASNRHYYLWRSLRKTFQEDDME